jgi:glycosyltransferase involved in cell wall biosynthesis
MDLHGKHLLEGLAESGHKIIVISTRHPSGKEYEEVNGIRIFYLPHTTFGSPRKGWKRESINKFTAIVEEEEIHAVLSQSRAAYGIAKTARKLRIPVIAIMHGYETMILRSVWNEVRNSKKGCLQLVKVSLATLYYSIFQEYPVLLNSSAIIAVSDNLAKVLEKKPFVDKNKITVIHCGIDLTVFNPSDEKRRKIREYLNISNQHQVILFLSLLSKQKGADVVLRAVKELSTERKDIKLVIAGDGEYLTEARRLAKELHIEQSVSFPGFIPNEETSGYYNAADVFVFPTLRLESFGIVIAEAMACGKPVIASNIGSIPDVIDDGLNGILIPPGDYQELAKQINRLLKEREYCKKLSENSIQKANEKFGLNRMVEETSAVLKSHIKDRSSVSGL